MIYIYILSVAVIITVLFIVLMIKKSRLRKKLLNTPFTSKQVEIVKRNIPYYSQLPASQQQKLQGLTNVFLNEKRFEGCGGLIITDEIKITIAIQACILIINTSGKIYPKLQTILVYPHAYQHNNQQGVILGESWQNGPVVLSWDDVCHGAKNIHDGRNVVFHEFSHQLDQLDGVADGAPILDNNSCYRSWAAVLGKEFEQMNKKINAGRKTFLDEYGATKPAEFFAVATEHFFEKPEKMQEKHPKLYQELKKYYKQDPAALK